MLTLLTAALLAAPLQVRTPADSAAAARDSIRLDSMANALDRARVDSLAAKSRRPIPLKVKLTPELLANAFVDPRAKEMMSRARVARLKQDSTLVSYDATTVTRISVGLALSKWARDRLAFRTENAARVRWHRDRGAWVELKGRRSVAPIAMGATDIEEDIREDLDSETENLELIAVPYYPGREPLVIGGALARAEIGDEDFIHPLALGSEAYYRYSSGDSIEIRLGDGRRIRVSEMRVRPRRPSWNVVVGSLWFDTETGQLVRGAFRLAEQLDIWTEIEKEGDSEDIPFWVKPMITPMRAELSSVTIEYGLHEGRFWLPRAQTISGMAVVGFMRAPVEMTTAVRYASVNGLDSIPSFTPPRRAHDTTSARSAAERLRDSIHARILDSLKNAPKDTARGTNVSITIGSGSRDHETDSARLETRARQLTRAAIRERNRRSIRQCDTSAVQVTTSRRYDGTLPIAYEIPCDRSVLATSPELPPSIFAPGEELFDRASRDELMGSLDLDAQAQWSPQRPTLKYGVGDGLARYNRIEGLSLGARAEQRLGAGYHASATARLATADIGASGGEIGITRSNGRVTLGLGAYRRLAVANDFERPFGFGSSLNALLFGRDDGLYYHANGIEFTGIGESSPRVEWRLFAERQQIANQATGFSFASAIGNTEFRPNIEADEGTFAGMAWRTGGSLGTNPAGWRLLTDARFEGAFALDEPEAYTRVSADLTVSRGLGRYLAGALTGAGGIVVGDVPVQRLFFLGGTRTVRGEPPGAAVGDLFWLGRGELATGIVAARPTLFADVGWAGDRFLWDRPGKPIMGVGIGASFLDGMLRTDLSRGIRPEKAWRFDLYVEARF